MSNLKLDDEIGAAADRSTSSTSSSSSDQENPLEGAVIEPSCVEFTLIESTGINNNQATSGSEILILHDFFDGSRVAELKVGNRIVKTGVWVPSDKAIADAIDKHAQIKKKHPERHEMWSIHFSDCEHITWEDKQTVLVKYDTETSNLTVGESKIYVMLRSSGPVRNEGL
jgi:hypothetical protein